MCAQAKDATRVDAEQSDDITGMLVPAWFKTALEAAFRLTQRDNSPLSATLLDIEGFKLINDTHGLDDSDSLLAVVSAAVAAEVSRPSFGSRYAGGELAFALPNDAIAASVTAGDLPAGVTTSIGVATFPEDASSPAELLHLADRTLYRAKETGRDRVCANEERDAHRATQSLQCDKSTTPDAGVGRGRSAPAPVAVITFDLDGFLQVNEERGRAAGHMLPKHVARTLEGNFGKRAGYTVARHGDEEFLVVLQSATSVTAFVLVEEVRRIVEAGPLSVEEDAPPLEIRLSAGVASAPVDSNDEAELLCRADEALYRANQQGHNRVALPALTRLVTKSAHFTRT